MMENHVCVCLEQDHDWCAIPLHEDAQICAKCGEIRQPLTAELSEIAELEDDLLDDFRSCDHKEEVSLCW